MNMRFLRGALIYGVVAGSLMVASQFVVLSTALARNAVVAVPWMGVLALVVAVPLSLFIVQRVRDGSRRLGTDESRSARFERMTRSPF